VFFCEGSPVFPPCLDLDERWWARQFSTGSLQDPAPEHEANLILPKISLPEPRPLPGRPYGAASKEAHLNARLQDVVRREAV
jgi:hypothetical protein